MNSFRNPASWKLAAGLLHNMPLPDWASIFPVLDQILATLRPDQRDALLLYYLESLSLEETASALALDSHATRIVIDSALSATCRELLARGVKLSSAMLAAMLTLNGHEIAPAELERNVLAIAHREDRR